MTNKLQQYFPMIRTREEVLNEIESKSRLKNLFYEWTEENKNEFLDFCTGVKGIKIMYDFMIKEIHEQPKAVRDTLNSVLKDDRIDLSEVGLTDEEIKKISQIYIVARGSAYHVGMAAQYVIEDLTRIPVGVELASEFRYRNPILDPEGLVVIVSQSGETADSLAALREAKQRSIRTLGIVNVVGSSIAREADNVFYTLAGPEISVATTKAYSTQLIASYVLAVQFGKVREQITEEKYKEVIAEVKTLPDKIA